MDETDHRAALGPNPSFTSEKPMGEPRVSKDEHIEAIRYLIIQLLEESDEHTSAYRTMHQILPHLDAIEGKTVNDQPASTSWTAGKPVTW